jgi:hypothetical protein
MTPTTSPEPDFDDDAVPLPPVAVAPAEATAEAELLADASSGFEVSLGAAACNAFSGSTIPYPY